MVYPVLCERMAPQRARRLALLGQPISAAEAAALGLVDQLVADSAALEGALSALARQLLRVQPAAAARTKALARQTAAQPFDEALVAGAACTGAILADPQCVAHVRAFLDGEPLPWFARYRSRAK
jgi:enoyl-CoA hydratase/carnithine racemase